jgi:hypothetical protein
VEFFLWRSQTKKKAGTERISCPNNRLQFVTRSLFDYFFQANFESSIHRRICNMVGVITDYF